MKRYKVEIKTQYNLIEDDERRCTLFDQFGQTVDSAHNIDILLKYWDAVIVEELEDEH